jgi:hypothetical protein
MSILWKMTVFIEKPLVTSSNCYETMKNASILIKLGTKVDWTFAFVTTCSVLNLLLPWQRGDSSKLPKITILRWFFPSKLILKCCNFSMDWDRVKGFFFSVGYTLPYNRPGVIFSLSQVQNFLGNEGTTDPLKTPQTAHPPSGNSLVYFLDGGRRRKSGHLF